MVYTCCFCDGRVQSISGLCTHMQMTHASNALTVYQCKQQGCLREYDTLRTFRKHLMQKHTIVNDLQIIAEDENPIVLGDDEIVQNGIPLQGENFAAINEPRPLILEENVVVNVPEFQRMLSQSSLALAAKLYACPNFNRTHVQNILDFVKEFASSGYMETLKYKSMSILTAHNVPVEHQDELYDMFNAMRDMFKGLETEHQRVNAFQESDCYVHPVTYILGVGENMRTVGGNPVFQQVELTGQFIPMKEVLQRYLELPGVFTAIMENVQKLKETDLFSNFVQGTLWHHIESHFVNRTVLPLYLYFDDVEPDNLGSSHSGDHKLGAVYYQIPCIPQHLVSSLENIFVAAIFSSDDRSLNNGAAFAPIMDALSELETNGIMIHTETGDHRVYFALGLILGDNLALNSVLGFVESFSANFYCRICREHRDTMRRQLRENDVMLRNRYNYELDVDTNNPALTGVKSRCIWNRLISFYVTLNIIVDIMHDLLEGVCHYVLCAILQHLVFQMRYLSLQTLNERVQSFHYGSDVGNKPSLITEDHIAGEKLRMSAAEMLFFVSHLGLMIGDLIPENDECWQLYVKLTQIIDILKVPYVRREQCEYLKTLIAEHHEMYCRLFNTHLKPKFHFMVHYPNIMNAIGPLIHVWSMRMEGKHRPIIKLVAKNMYCRKNLPLSVALKYAFSLCAKFLAKRGFPSDASFVSNEQRIVDCENYHLFAHILPPGLDIASVVSQAIICGSEYKKNMLLVINYQHELPIFGRIQWIIRPYDANVKAIFILSGINTVRFSEHLHAYLVAPNPEWFCVNYEELVSYYTCVARFGADGAMYVTFPHAL